MILTRREMMAFILGFAVASLVSIIAVEIALRFLVL